MKNILIVAKIAFVAVALTFAGCSDSKPATASDKNGFEIVDLDGKKSTITVQISDAKYNDLILDESGGKPTIYSFFSTKCPECIKKFPHLIDMQNRIGDKINLIGVLVEDKSLDEIKDFVDFYNLNYKITLGRGSYKLADAVGGVRMIPALHIYDKDGKYIAHYIGGVAQEMIESRINSLIADN